MRSQTIGYPVLSACLASAALALPAPAAAQASTGWTEKQLAQRAEQFAKLTPEHFARTSRTEEDDLEVVATIHTQPGHIFTGGFKDSMRADSFLRALVDKLTGTALYQVYASLRYTGEWRRFTSARYETDRGPVSAPLQIVERDVDCQYVVCVYTEEVAFEVPEHVLISLTQRAGARSTTPWRFRFKAQSGLDWTDDMAPVEAAGILLAVERYRSSRTGGQRP